RVPARPAPDDPTTFLPNGAAAKTGLNRVIHDSLWGRFATRLNDKMETVGVSPAYTSQRCHSCGYTGPDNRKSQAIFRCTSCGHTDNADLNSAKNIRDAGAAQRRHPPTGGTGWPGEAVGGDANLQT